MKREDALAIIADAGYQHARVEFIDGPFPGWLVEASHTAHQAPERRATMPTLRHALMAAGFDAPASPDFVALGAEVVRAGEMVARAVSKTMAKRIANALNVYEPNARGR